MRQALGKIILYIGVAAILLSAGLSAYAYLDENRAKNSAAQTAWALTERIRRDKTARAGELGAAPVNTAESPDEDADGGEGVPERIEIGGETYIGVLSIPALSLELPVNSEFSEAALKNAPCRYTGNFAGGLVVGAHNYKHHFGELSRLSYGDAVVVTDANGTEHWYTVVLVEILPETDIDARINSPYALTLFTCTKGRTERITVRCAAGRPEDAARGATKAPSYRINYIRETVSLRKGALYSTDGGASFTAVTEAGGVTLDVSGLITGGAPVFIKKAATNRQPESGVQTVMPVARAVPETRALVPVNGRLSLGGEYEVYNPATGKWGRLPRVNADAEFAVRLKSTARTVEGVVTGSAASLHGRLTITFGEYAPGKTGVVAAELVF
ncbi:MAG: sortase [Oscillospiraceae bacterium]|nr:sortase [Oscillospiraceae bacterium]